MKDKIYSLQETWQMTYFLIFLEVIDMKHLSLNEIVPQKNDYKVLQETFKSNLALLPVF